MAGGGQGGGSQPSTTTQITDIPEWQKEYVTDLMGKAQAIAAEPYQQFAGQQIAGFTPQQLQAFQNIQGSGAYNQANQNAAMQTAQAGANSAGDIYNTGAGYVNASTGYNPLDAISPYLNSASGYNAASAAQPWLNQAGSYQSQAVQAGSPLGIQSYMSPYTDSVVRGIQDQANLNWNQNIMPGLNDKFVGSGQYGSGRNAQVLGQAAGNFQTGLSANVANALQSGYGMAGSQAAQQAALLSGLGGQSLTGANTAAGAQSSQIANLLNQGTAAGTAAQQQATNLQNAGTQLGNLAATQAGQQTAAGTALGNLGSQAASTNLAQNQALQGAGQQQQQLNQSNLDLAKQDWMSQVNWPKEQTQYLNQIIRGLPQSSLTTSSSLQTPAYSVSPLSGVSGALTAGLGLLTGDGKKKGGIIKGYANGGMVDEDYLDLSPLDYSDVTDISDATDAVDGEMLIPQDETPVPLRGQGNPLEQDFGTTAPSPKISTGVSQRDQLLAMARGLLTPTAGGSPYAGFGQGIGNVQDLVAQQKLLDQKQQAENRRLDIEQQNADSNEAYREGMLGIKQGLANPTNPVNSDLTGEEYLKTLPNLRAANAKAASEGRLAITPFLLKTPYGQQLLNDTMQYDPSYDAAAAPARVATRKDFTSGPSSKNITSLNTALGHISSLADNMKKLNNTDYAPLNYLENKAKGSVNYPELKAYKASVGAVADELTRLFRGTGGTLTEIQEWKKSLSENMTPDEQDAALKQLADLVDSRLDALGQTYERGMGKSVEASSFLTPKAKLAYDKIHGITDEKITDSGIVPTTTPAASNSIKAAIAAERARRKGVK